MPDGADVPEGDQRRVLHGVLRVGPVAQHAQRHGPHAGLVPLQQHSDSGHVPVARDPQQLRVGRILVQGTSHMPQVTDQGRGAARRPPRRPQAHGRRR